MLSRISIKLTWKSTFQLLNNYRKSNADLQQFLSKKIKEKIRKFKLLLCTKTYLGSRLTWRNELKFDSKIFDHIEIQIKSGERVSSNIKGGYDSILAESRLLPNWAGMNDIIILKAGCV